MAVLAVSAAVAAIGAALTVGTVSAAAIAFGTSLALGLVSRALAPKQKALTGSYGEDFTRNFKSSISERILVYGEVRIGGAIAFIGSTEENKYLHMVVLLASHEIDQIGEIIINEQSISLSELDANGFVNTGTYKNKVRIKKHLGADNQTADTDLVSEVDEWTNDHRLQGIAYIYARLEFDRNIFPSGIPNISAYVKGKKLRDPRTDVTEFSSNIALIANDYLKDQKYGFQVASDRIDQSYLFDSADNCDEMQTVTNKSFPLIGANTVNNTITINKDKLFLQRGDQVVLTGANLPNPFNTFDTYYVIPFKRNKNIEIQLATSFRNAILGNEISLTSQGSLNNTQNIIKQAEPRYYGGGVLSTKAEIGSNLQEILSGMAGSAIYTGGKWKILSGQYYTPVYAFNINDLASQISVSTKKSKKDRFNRVKGTFTSPVNNNNQSDYPHVKNSLYQSEDGEVITKDMALPFTQRPSTAQRIAKIELERQRQEITFSASFNLTAFKVSAGDNIQFTFDRYGWSNKVFEIIEWSLGIDDTSDLPTPVVNMTLQENASAVYDWNNGEETVFDPAPNSLLPDPFTVPPITGLSLDSILVDSQGGDKTFKVLASWQLPTNQYVLQGGFCELEFKKSNETIYKSVGKVDGEINELEIPQLAPNVLYDIRIRAFNNVRAKSPYTTIQSFNIGDTITTDTEDWENEILARSGADWEANTFTNEDWE